MLPSNGLEKKCGTPAPYSEEMNPVYYEGTLTKLLL